MKARRILDIMGTVSCISVGAGLYGPWAFSLVGIIGHALCWYAQRKLDEADDFDDDVGAR